MWQQLLQNLWIAIILNGLLIAGLSAAASTPTPDAATPLLQATPPAIYKHVDGQGNVSYSDTPADKQAELMELDQLETLTLPKTKSFPSSKPSSPPFKYQLINITSPTNDTHYQNLSEPIQINAEVQPHLQPGHSLNLLLDGNIIEGSGLSRQITLLERGTHTLKAEVRDANQQVLISSAPITVYVHRSKLNKPAAAQKPAGFFKSLLD